MADEKDTTAYREAEAWRHDPRWGDPAEDLAVFTYQWLYSALARHPDRRDELDALQRRLWEASWPAVGWHAGTCTDGELVRALEEIVGILRAIAPLLRDQAREQ